MQGFMHPRPIGRGGFEGVRANPPFDLQMILMYTSKLHIISILPFESGPLVSLLLPKRVWLQLQYASSFMGDQREHARNLFTPLR